MTRYIRIFLAGCIFSCFLFPIHFMFMKTLNTKMILAAMGVCLFLYNNFVKEKTGIHASRSMFYVTCAALAVSACSLLSVAINKTNDYVYVSYVVSMWVWVGAAYFAAAVIERVHGEISIELVGKYFVFVCVGQCVCALLNEFVPPFCAVVDRVVYQWQDMLKAMNRMYGIGASLDVAGSRFACALIFLSGLISSSQSDENPKMLILYSLSFVFLAIVGCMVARTTTVGIILATLYVLFDSKIWTLTISKGYAIVLMIFLTVAIISVPTVRFFYNKSPEFKELFEFGFEAFFNSSSEGEFHTTSTDMLLEMWKKTPETLHTWLIGDGYMNNPNFINENYVGDETTAFSFYKATDVGYLRFIFYFGLVGLLTFAFFFVVCTVQCCHKAPEYKRIFVFFLIMNLVLWAKVATDVFVVFAAFLVVSETETQTSSLVV